RRLAALDERNRAAAFLVVGVALPAAGGVDARVAARDAAAVRGPVAERDG
ncbi:MAG: hypothetical protein AVDCRST_MAG79-651, partial [uncultured Thermoleophilia bacterium]